MDSSESQMEAPPKAPEAPKISQVEQVKPVDHLGQEAALKALNEVTPNVPDRPDLVQLAGAEPTKIDFGDDFDKTPIVGGEIVSPTAIKVDELDNPNEAKNDGWISAITRANSAEGLTLDEKRGNVQEIVDKAKESGVPLETIKAQLDTLGIGVAQAEEIERLAKPTDNSTQESVDNSKESPSPNSPDKIKIRHGETSMENVVWEQRTSSEWKKIPNEEDKYRVYIDVQPEQYIDAVKLTNKVVTGYDRPVDWKFVQRGSNAEIYINKKDESKIVVYCASQEDAQRFAETFVNTPEAQKFKSMGSDFATHPVGENGVVSYGRGTKENRSIYQWTAGHSLEEYLAKDPSGKAHTKERYFQLRQKAIDYGYKLI